jgi:hypothetical protein
LGLKVVASLGATEYIRPNQISFYIVSRVALLCGSQIGILAKSQCICLDTAVVSRPPV